MQMRQKLPILRSSIHPRKEQTQRRQVIRRLNRKTLNHKTKAWPSSRQEKNRHQQRDSSAINLLRDNPPHLRTTEVTSRPVHTPHRPGGQRRDGQGNLRQVIQAVGWEETGGRQFIRMRKAVGEISKILGRGQSNLWEISQRGNQTLLGRDRRPHQLRHQLPGRSVRRRQLRIKELNRWIPKGTGRDGNLGGEKLGQRNHIRSYAEVAGCHQEGRPGLGVTNDLWKTSP